MSDQFIGVDVGGTKIAVAVLEGGELSRVARSSPTNQASQEALVEQLAVAIEGSMTPRTTARSASACRRSSSSRPARSSPASTSRCTTSRCASC